jgi:hypothetical protein
LNRTNPTKAEQKLMKIEQLMNNDRKLATNMSKHYFTEQTKLRVELWTFNIFKGKISLWLWNWQLQPCLPGLLVMRHQMSCCRFLCISSRLPRGLLENQRIPQQLCCFVPTTPVQSQSSSIIAMIVSLECREITGSYHALKGHSASGQRGIVLVESTQIR